MKTVIFGAFLGMLLLSPEAGAKTKTFAQEDLNCRTDNDYCRSADGRLLTGRVMRSEEGNVVIQNYKNGRPSGLTTVLDEQNRPVRKTYYKEGRKNGIERLYYENRTIKSSAEYKDGLLNGQVDYYTEKGKRKGRLTYKDGLFDKGYCIVDGRKMNIDAGKTDELISCGE